MRLFCEPTARDPLAEVDSLNEKSGGFCAGQAHVCLENIKENHGIIGSLAAAEDSIGYLHHAALVIECSDGIVFVDSRSCPEDRLFAIPYRTSYKHGERTGFIAASEPGVQPPLTQIFLNEKGKEVDRHQFYTNIVNADDGIAKMFMAHTSTHWMPIATYKKDGKPLKDIKVFLQEEKIVLKDHVTGAKKTVRFSDIQENGCLADLELFMEEDFNYTPEKIHNQICKVASQSKRIIAFFEGARRDYFQKLEDFA